MRKLPKLSQTLLAMIWGLCSTVFINNPASCAEPLQLASALGAQDTTMNETDAQGYSPEVREYHLKAAFLRYVAKFVEWPDEVLPPGTINLCVLGLVPSFEALNSINGKIVNDRAIAITKIPNLTGAKSQQCQILFVTKTEEDKVNDVIKATQNESILSYGDMENFAQAGGCMNFYILNNRLAIMINPPAVAKAKLKIDPRMLRLVTVVPPADQE